MSLKNRVKSYIEDNSLISAGDTVILALSGGADSVCLFLILHSLREELDFKLKAVHVNHGIRGEQADADEEFVKRLCEKNQTELLVFHKNIPATVMSTGESEEECGRRIRYEILNSEAEKFEAAKIAVAHHRDDQAETVIFRMVRGTGIKGISGMRPNNGKIIRPLLGISREEIEAFLADRKQNYCEDATNKDSDYSRNYIRNDILPMLERINSSSREHICALAEDASEIWNYIEEEAQELMHRAVVTGDNNSKVGHKKYSTDVILDSKPIVRNCAIRKIIEEYGASLKDVTREHIDNIVRIMEKTEYAGICLPRGIRVISEAGFVYVTNEEPAGDFTFMCLIEGEGVYELPNGDSVICRIKNDFCVADIPQSRYTKWFDYDKISNGFCIRNKREGDYLIVNARGDRKKLKDYLINEKIPKTERDSMCMVANDSRIAWVIGHRISEDVKVSDSTRCIMEIQFVKGEESHG